MYNNYAKIYLEKIGETPDIKTSLPPILWSEADSKHLATSRSQMHPPTFRAIANELNRYHERTGIFSLNIFL